MSRILDRLADLEVFLGSIVIIVAALALIAAPIFV
jgi:hypothetical protein